jgi:hypothetical protein
VKGIVAVAVCIVALMVAIKDGRVLQSAGLTASCSPVAQVAGGAVWEACTRGKLEGRPDLTKRNCKPAAIKSGLQYWLCPADVQPSDAGR